MDGAPAIIPFIELCVFFLKVKTNNSSTLYIPLQSRILSGSTPTSTNGQVFEFLSEAGKNSASPRHVCFLVRYAFVTISKTK
jgi:hypothetical protein